MKRFHVHVSVEDLAASVRFYSTLFGAAPTVHKDDYAKWMLEDPRINFAISQRGRAPGVDHLGFQVDSEEELSGLRKQLEAADAALIEEAQMTCCYSRADKYWITDPTGIAWEAYHTLGDAPMYGEERKTAKSACCGPASAAPSVTIEQAKPQTTAESCAPDLPTV